MLPTPPQSPKPFGLCAPEDRINHILAGRIQLTGILGVGAYGTVYQAVDLQTNVQYAVKALNKAGLDPRQRRFQEREIRLHHLANEHANVVSMLKIWDTPDCTYVVLEYCTEGDLFAKITDEGDYIGDDHKTREVFLQILDAVQHCHSRGIYHRDLKPENILVKDDGWTVKLADFGLATQDSITSDYGCGSTFYMSPECQESYTNPLAGYKSVPNDVWSLGVILVNLTCGRNPWKRASIEDSTFRAYRQDPDFLQTILPISTEINDILQRIFDVNPETRIGLHELRDRIAHCRFFSQGTQEAAERLECMLPPTPDMTPHVSPVGKPIDSVNLPYSLEPVPEVDLLPCSGFSQYINSQPTTPYGMLTPPNSNPGSPQLLPQLSPQPLQYTFPVRPVPPVPNLPTTYQTGFSPFFPSTFSKYSGFVPQLGTFCWRNGPISVW